MSEEYVYYNHHRKVCTVVSSNVFLAVGECRPYDSHEVKFIAEHGYREVSKYEYLRQ